MFRRARIIGRRFRIVHVMFRDETIEVSTYRSNHENAGGMWMNTSRAPTSTSAHARQCVLGRERKTPCGAISP